MGVLTLPSANDINITIDFTALIGVSTVNIGFKNVLEDTDPQFGLTADLGLDWYSGSAGGYSLFNLAIKSSNGSRGLVSVDSPWTQSSSGTTTIGTTRQAYEYYSGTIDIRATGIYPFVFNYWYESSSATYYYSSTLSFSPYDAETQDPFALFTAYFV
jgi:hypothetical protein